MTKKPKKLTAKQVRRQDEEGPASSAGPVASQLIADEAWELVKEAYLTYKPLFVVWANDEEGVELPHGFWTPSEARAFVDSHPDKDELMIDSYNHRSGPRLPLIREH